MLGPDLDSYCFQDVFTIYTFKGLNSNFRQFFSRTFGGHCRYSVTRCFEYVADKHVQSIVKILAVNLRDHTKNRCELSNRALFTTEPS